MGDLRNSEILIKINIQLLSFNIIYQSFLRSGYNRCEVIILSNLLVKYFIWFYFDAVTFH